MDRGMLAGAPSPTLAKKKIDITQLPPEMQAQLASGKPITHEDGSVIYPDGTASGAGDSPDDYAPGFAAGPAAGNAILAGEPAPVVDAAPVAAEPANPLAGPMFRPYRQRANAAFPGTPGGVGGGPVAPPNPLVADAPAPALDAAPSVQIQINPNPNSAANGATMRHVGPSQGGEDQPGRTINFGRRQMTTRRVPTRQQPNNGIFQRKPRDAYGR